MSGFEDLQQKLVQAKAVMDKVDGTSSNTNNTQRNIAGITNTHPTKAPTFNNNTKQPNTAQSNNTQKISQSGLKSLIRDTIKESLGDLIDESISERMTKSNKISESIKIVVGGTVFEGRITSTKKLN